MVQIPKKSGKGKGPYWEKKGKEVHITCANGHQSKLIQHAVLDDGTVVPGVQCPIRGCKFGGDAYLSGWKEEHE